jgi:hypothetical protein
MDSVNKIKKLLKIVRLDDFCFEVVSQLFYENLKIVLLNEAPISIKNIFCFQKEKPHLSLSANYYDDGDKTIQIYCNDDLFISFMVPILDEAHLTTQDQINIKQKIYSDFLDNITKCYEIEITALEARALIDNNSPPRYKAFKQMKESFSLLSKISYREIDRIVCE